MQCVGVRWAHNMITQHFLNNLQQLPRNGNLNTQILQPNGLLDASTDASTKFDLLSEIRFLYGEGSSVVESRRSLGKLLRNNGKTYRLKVEAGNGEDLMNGKPTPLMKINTGST